jgi:hypothetical protein
MRQAGRAKVGILTSAEKDPNHSPYVSCSPVELMPEHGSEGGNSCSVEVEMDQL